ncbi:hypothetical protein [Brevibacterium permense]|uniref:hypothetical protein n=1 Tax=Brevibacterium permense TaxID=234834 RepID=UPI0021D1DA53|nr:hypothetical protein [Brevibacterium permense]
MAPREPNTSLGAAAAVGRARLLGADDRLTVTSLGRVPFDLADLTPGVILP